MGTKESLSLTPHREQVMIGSSKNLSPSWSQTCSHRKIRWILLTCMRSNDSPGQSCPIRCPWDIYLLSWTQCKHQVFSAKMDSKQVFFMTQHCGTFDDTHPTTTGPDPLLKSPVLAMAPAGTGWLCLGCAQTQHPLGHLTALPPHPRHRKMKLSPNPLLPLNAQSHLSHQWHQEVSRCVAAH